MEGYLSKKITAFLFVLFLVWPISAIHASNLSPQDDPSSTVDSDSDGLTDYQEVHIYHTDPQKADTDGDGFTDGAEVKNGYSPLVPNLKINQVDTDHDGLNDDLEIKLGTDLTNPDTDGDGHNDGQEVSYGYNPLRGNDDHSMPRRVEVDQTKQQMYYFLNNVQIGTIPVSTGLPKTPTPNGTYKIITKKLYVDYFGVNYSYPNTKWNLLFNQGQLGYYLHGAFWHNEFGIEPMSHGCVNIAYNNAEKIYNFLDVGDSVKVYGKWTGKWKTPTKVKAAVLGAKIKK